MQQLSLNIESDKVDIALQQTPADVSAKLVKLKKRVFTFAGAEADELAFKNRIVEYLNGKAESTLTDTMRNIVWERNSCGKTTKYLYFNERIQRLYLDRNFFEWCKIVCNQLSEELNNVDANK